MRGSRPTTPADATVVDARGVALGDVLPCNVLRRCASVLSLAVVSACSPPRATLLTELPESGEVGAAAERYALNADNTDVEVEVSAGATFSLSFSKLAGTLAIDPRNPSRSRLELTIDTRTATSSIDRVAEVAMSEHFLDVEVYPRTSFESRTVTAAEEGYTMTGELTLHGVTRGLRMPIQVEVEPCSIDYEVAFSFDRHAFGMQTEGRLESLVADTIAVLFIIEVERPCQADG